MMKTMPVRAPIESKEPRWETITPERAAKMLERFFNVRPLLRSHVVELAHAMTMGTWTPNGATILIDEKGFVVDGEHRLRACVMAGVPFRTLVVYGFPRENVMAIDSGQRRRTAGQVVKARGTKNANSVAALAKALILSERGIPPARLCQMRTVDVSGLVLFIEQDQANLEQAVVAIGPALRSTRLPLAALALIAYRAATSPKLEPFLTFLATGEGGRRGDPVFALRERVLSGYESTRIETSMACALTWKAWNATVKGVRVEVLRIGPNEEIALPLED